MRTKVDKYRSNEDKLPWIDLLMSYGIKLFDLISVQMEKQGENEKSELTLRLQDKNSTILNKQKCKKRPYLGQLRKSHLKRV